MSSIYSRLGFNSSDPLTNSTSQELNANVKVQLELLPDLLTPWQIKDIAEANTSGYFVNPLANTISNITITSQNMMNVSSGVGGSTNAISDLIANTRILSNTIVTTTGPGFLYHTNRISNVIPPDENNDEAHYLTAMGVGKMMIYIVSQSDGIENNSPIMGNFTALYTGNTLNNTVTLASNWVTTLNNSITYSTVGTPPNVATVKTSNFTLSQAQEMYDTYANLNSTMVNYRNQDNTFFLNSRAVMDDYNKVRDFTKMGQTETDLVYNKIGSTKIIERLNDTANN